MNKPLFALAAIALIGGALAGSPQYHQKQKNQGKTTQSKSNPPKVAKANAFAIFLSMDKNEADLSKFVQAVEKSGLATSYHGKEPITIFAPANNDPTWAQMGSKVEAWEKNLDTKSLAHFVRGFATVGELTLAKLQKSKSITNLNGEKETITVNGKDVIIAGQCKVISVSKLPGGGAIVRIGPAAMQPQGK